MPLDSNYRGISDSHVIPHSEILRTYGDKRQALPTWRDRESLAILLFMAGASFAVFRPTGIPFLGIHVLNGALDWLPPVLFFFVLLFSLPAWLLSKPPRAKVPFNLPIQSGRMEPASTSGGGKPRRASGTVFAGNVAGENSLFGPWVFLSMDRLVQHCAFIGTTGSGKSSAFLGMVANALIQGSGIFLIDGKADLTFFAQFVALTRIFNRGYDLRFINFLNIDPDIAESFNTNTMNMFASAPADDMYNLIVSLKSDMGKENKTFSDRGESLAHSVISMLCWARDNRELSLSIEDVRDYITNLDNVFRLALGCLRDGVEFDGAKGFQDHVRSVYSYVSEFMSAADIAAYAYTVLGIDVRNLKYVSDELRKAPRQELDGAAKSEITKQHGFAVMSFNKAFKTVTSGYFRVFGDRWGDVTIDDVVKNRRIVIVMLPSLGKAQSEVMALSKVMISNIRGMASRSLGSKLLGKMDKLLSAKTTQANSPYILGFDELGSYMQQGIDEINKQVRGLNFGVMLGFQDIPGLRRHDAATADSALGSANYIYFMRIQDPQTTGETATRMAGDAYAAFVQNFEKKTAILRDQRTIDSDNITIRETKKVTFSDLQGQPIGGAHLIAEGKTVRMQMFYVEPTSCIRKELIDTEVRRLAGWAPPDPVRVVLSVVDGARPAPPTTPVAPAAPRAQAGSGSVSLPGRTHAGAIYQPDGTLGHPAARERAIRHQFIPDARQPAGGETVFPHLPPQSLLFDDDQPPIQPEIDEPDSESLLPRDATSAATDPYNIWVQRLEASASNRQRSEAQAPALVQEYSSCPGPIEIGYEFLHLSCVGMPIALRDDSAIDLCAMICGLVSLCGIRTHNRRDERPPPYVPMSWRPGEFRDGPISDTEAGDALGRRLIFGGQPPEPPPGLDLSQVSPWGDIEHLPDDTSNALRNALSPAGPDPFDDDGIGPLVETDGPHQVDPDAIHEGIGDDENPEEDAGTDDRTF